MTDQQWDRIACLSGIAFALCLVVGFALFGDAPKVDAAGGDVAAFYTDNSGRILTGVPIICVGFVFLLWFAGAVANRLRESGQNRLASTALALAAAEVGVAFVVQAMSAALALNIADRGDEGANQAVNTLSWAIDAAGSFLVAGFILSATLGLRRASLIPSWFGWFGLAAALLVALRGTTWASDGFWSPSGGYVYVLLVCGLGWAIVTSVLLYRAAPAPARVPETVVPAPPV
jgi:hypothetical protein